MLWDEIGDRPRQTMPPCQFQTFIHVSLQDSCAGLRVIEIVFHPAGRSAITLWRALRPLDGIKRDGISFDVITRVWLRPVTGRSHQLRAHLAGIGHPILGDPIYGDVGRPGRLRLHAHALSFRHPFTQERVRLISAPTFL